VAVALTTSRVHDSRQLPEVLDRTLGDICQVSADKAYDSRGCYEAILERRARPPIPPRRKARLSRSADPPRGGVARDDVLRRIKAEGRYGWRTASGATRQSLAENAVSRFKAMVGVKLAAERIKQEIGSAYPGLEVREMEVRGRNLAEGVPRSFVLNSNEILVALQEPLSGIVSAVRMALEQTPPELGADVAERGMVLTGGGALLRRDLDRLLMEETAIPVIIAKDPLTCVARGGGRALETVDEKGVDIFATE